MISKRDSKPFLVKFPIGSKKDSSTEKIYEDSWNVCYGLIGEPSGGILRRVYGNELDFDKVIVMNYGSNTKRINYDTVILVDNMPTSVFDGGDYSIRYIFPPYNGEQVIGLEKKQAINIPKLYFYHNNELMYAQFNLDNETHIAYAGKNEIVPFDVGQSVWLREPTSQEDTPYRYTVTAFNNVGMDSHYKPFLEIVLQEYQNA